MDRQAAQALEIMADAIYTWTELRARGMSALSTSPRSPPR